jgi:hypothetical protein
MADRHHYVAQFHLRGFLDPESIGSRDPWLWMGDCADGEVRRRSPQNLGWKRGLYDQPGAFSSPDANLEEHLAEQIEGPAAAALYAFVTRTPGSRGPVPPEIGRYVAWAASRTPAMREHFQAWLDSLPADLPMVERPPQWMLDTEDRIRPHRMEHPVLGVRDDVLPSEVASLQTGGWKLVLNDRDFGELLHLQAYYLLDRHFPRLQWCLLDAPPGAQFVIGDRPVVWGIAGDLSVTPAALRLGDAQLVVPLTSTVAWFAQGPAGERPNAVTPTEVNGVIAAGASDWIAGPTREVVLEALELRRQRLVPRAI